MLNKMPYSSAMLVMKNYTPSGEATALAAQYPAPADFLIAAQQQAHYGDAVIFLAHGLPLKEALWWGYHCAQQLTEWSEQEQCVLESVRDWITRSGESERRACGDAAKQQGLSSAAGWLAQAVFWSTGSMLDAGQPPLPAPPFLYAQALSGAINLMAVMPDGACIAEHYRAFLAHGLAVARGDKQ